jgi:hypothetical protein
MTKRRAESQIDNLTLDHKKSRSTPISLRASGMPNIIVKILMKDTTLLQNLSRSKVCRRSYGTPKLRESKFQEFQNSNLGVPGKNVIWVLAPWLGTKNTIRGEGGGFPFVFAHGSFVHQSVPTMH